MKTFYVQTLGCKVNHYESEQIAALLLSRGLTPAEAGLADLRVINTCSVTIAAASQSRQSVRRMVKLPVLSHTAPAEGGELLVPPLCEEGGNSVGSVRSRVVVTGCWATSDPVEAAALPGVDAVLTHQHDVAGELDRLLTQWQNQDACHRDRSIEHPNIGPAAPSKSSGKEHGRQVGALTRTGEPVGDIEPTATGIVNEKVGTVQSANEVQSAECKVQSKFQPDDAASVSHSELCTLHSALSSPSALPRSLPLLGRRQTARQRAFLKIQDGCDAHCTYCIIPSLRPNLWSKPIDDAVEEARSLVAAGHVEIVLTGIFLGAYGQSTALRRRQRAPAADSLGKLIDALCTRVPGLGRLRLSSLEPGDLTDDLIAILRSHAQIVPHFHLPLQSGSEHLLRRMNRQYTRDHFLSMIERATAAFDRPALTTDVVVGFPGETDDEFQRTVEVVQAGGFIHIHAFPYSPRPGTAAARWTKQFVRGPVVNERIERLRDIAADQSLAFRSSFIGQTVEVIIERDSEFAHANSRARHGRCERYFDVEIADGEFQPGQRVRARIAEVTRERTVGKCFS
jgi:threonylcarbamoyladenosine tRNA methylthiotransferase MtaB